MSGGFGGGETLLLGGLALGLAFGAVLQRSHFCIMGGLADLLLFGSARRLRVWLLAIAVAVAGTQLLALSGVVAIDASPHLAAELPWATALLGGALFGFGMVLTGGCASRSLVRAAAGSLKSLVVLLVMGIAAWSAQLGVLAPLHRGLRAAGTLALDPQTPAAQGLWQPLAGPLGLDPDAARAGLAALVASALLLACLVDPRFRAARAEVLTGIALGLLVVGGWLLTGALAADPFAPEAPASLSYVGPVAQSLILLVTGTTGSALGPALVLGTVVGAALVAGLEKRFRLEGFGSVADLGRHLVGAALMGVGGVLAMGCTIGQGLTGLSTLGAGSLLATVAIVLGAVWALRWLETGRLVPLRAGRWGLTPGTSGEG